jgi:hypothetical protein
MGFDRFLTDQQPARDEPVRQSLYQQRKDVALSRGEAAHWMSLSVTTITVGAAGTDRTITDADLCQPRRRSCAARLD